MQEHGRRDQPGHQIAEVDDLIERIQVAGVVEAEKNEGGQAENIEVPRLVRAAAPEIDEQPDQQVCRAHHDTGTPPRGPGAARATTRWLDFDAAALDLVLRLAPRPDAHQHLGHVGGLLDGDAVDGEQAVADVDAAHSSPDRRL